MEEINFALALNKPHKSLPNYKISNGKELKKLNERFFTKDNKGKITKQELDNFEFKGINLNAIEANQKKAIQSLCGENYDYIDFEPDWRFIIGLGGASIYETGITLHHIYGIPYIPATSIKGVVRSWYLLDKYHDKKAEMEGYAIQDEEFCKVFGCAKDLKINGKPFESILKGKDGRSAEFEGNIIFFDAFPLTAPKLKLDIMTPHYQPYYDDKKGEKPPADYYSPNPIPFLTIENTKFRMYFGVKKEKDKALVETTHTWLKKALLQRGIGAKTAVGYGYQKNNIPSPKLPTNPAPSTNSNPAPEKNIEPREGLEMTIEVTEVKQGGQLIETTLPSNKYMSYPIKNAPKDLKVGDKVIAKCKMNKKGKPDYFIFISKLS
ncbi:MAG: type III-B CRISPR module RAMP protein Cmr6 [Microscillaceae bacterium]|nr:type III-B CRISPR module RAMP protein Cmr6 [Microscillaceae bacterium]